MHTSVFLVTLFNLVTFSVQYEWDTKLIDTDIDHFSYADNRTFKLRYLINDTYLSNGGPILFYTGNEGDITTFAKNTGFMFDIAPRLHGLIVFAEHRYYGTSLPFGNESFVSPKNIGYLTSQQALGDFIQVIDHLQNVYKPWRTTKKLPVIAFGGSYGGMLSAWIRMKYPGSVLGSIASSAPIWQFKGITPCENFNRVTTSVYGSFGSLKCTKTITSSWQIIRALAKTDAGKDNLQKLLNLCNSISSPDDVQTLIDWVAEIIVNMAMVNYPYPTNFLADLPAYPVLEFCTKLDRQSWNDDLGQIKALGEALQVYTNYTKTTKCNSVNSTSSDIGENTWNYQACTEIIMPMCSTKEDMFENDPWDFQKYSDNCFKKFNIRPRSENDIILEYGGKDIEAASNIVFSNGLLDPWSSGGVLRNINENVRAIVIPDGAHHYDLRGNDDRDTEAVKYVRNFHVEEIEKWIKKYYNYRPEITVI